MRSKPARRAGFLGTGIPKHRYHRGGGKMGLTAFVLPTRYLHIRYSPVRGAEPGGFSASSPTMSLYFIPPQPQSGIARPRRIDSYSTRAELLWPRAEQKPSLAFRRHRQPESRQAHLTALSLEGRVLVRAGISPPDNSRASFPKILLTSRALELRRTSPSIAAGRSASPLLLRCPTARQVPPGDRGRESAPACMEYESHEHKHHHFTWEEEKPRR
ncbi:unnamed protein product [Diplocarpon coronariae]